MTDLSIPTILLTVERPTAGVSVRGWAASVMFHLTAFSALVVTQQLSHDDAQISGRAGPMSLAAIASAPATSEFDDDEALMAPARISLDEERAAAPKTLAGNQQMPELVQVDDPIPSLTPRPLATLADFNVQLTAAEVTEAVATPSAHPAATEDHKDLPHAPESSVASTPSPASEGNQFDAAPIFNHNAPIPYPREAVDSGFDGAVILRIFIEVDGQVSKVELVHSCGHTVLDDAAVKAVKTWRGEPARAAGKPIAANVLLPVRFQLR